MKLTGKLKENVEKAQSKEQAKKIIAKAGPDWIEWWTAKGEGTRTSVYY